MLKWLVNIAFLGIGLGIAGPAQSAPACTAGTPTGTACSCNVNTLRPLQGAVGKGEVRAKADKIAEKPNKEWKDLEKDPIKVVRGPGGALFITDHHHGASAWRLAGHPDALCQIGQRPVFANAAAFWTALAADNLVRLADQNGKTITVAQLPRSLDKMPDDPYRTLAWRVRKEDGFCRSEMQRKEFAEFAWADWFRGRPELPASAVRTPSKAVIDVAVGLARGTAAAGLPGYVGPQGVGFKCPEDD